MNALTASTSAREIGNPYENLANAIIMSAASDYVGLLKAYKVAVGERRMSIAKNINDDEKFFRSRWFGVLTSMDADYLIEAMKKEVLGDEYEKVLGAGHSI